MLLYTNVLFYDIFFLKKGANNKNPIMIFEFTVLDRIILAKYGICISGIPDEINDTWMLLRLIITFYLFIQLFISIASLISISTFILSPIASTATTLFNSFLVLQRMAIIFDRKSLSKSLTNK